MKKPAHWNVYIFPSQRQITVPRDLLVEDPQLMRMLQSDRYNVVRSITHFMSYRDVSETL